MEWYMRSSSNHDGRQLSSVDSFEAFCEDTIAQLISQMSVNQCGSSMKETNAWYYIINAIEGLSWFQNSEISETMRNTIKIFFIGRCLAKMLFMGDKKEEEAVRIIQSVKYIEEYSEVISFLVGEISRETKMEKISKLLKVIDKGIVEPLGLQHLKLKMRCLEQWLLERDISSDARGMDKKFKVRGLTWWLKRGMIEVRQRARQVDETILKEVVSIMREFPSVIALMRERIFDMVLWELEREKWTVHSLVVQALGWMINVGYDDDVLSARLSHGLYHHSKAVRQSAIRCIPILGQTCRHRVHLLLTILKHIPISLRTTGYDKTVIKLFHAAPEHGDDFIDILANSCRCRDYWTRQEMVKSIPTILENASGRLDRLVSILLDNIKEGGDWLSPGVIEVLAVCLEKCPRHVNDVINVLLGKRKMMGDDEHRAVNALFSEAIVLDPSKAVEVIRSAFDEHEIASWSVVYPTVKAIVRRLGHIPNHATAVVDLIKKKHEEDKDELHALTLMLEAARNVSLLTGELQRTLVDLTNLSSKHTEWNIRSQAYQAAAEIIIDPSASLYKDLRSPLIRACQEENVWKAQCAAFEAAAKVLGNVNDPILLSCCHEAMDDDDDVVRCLAAQAVKAAVSENVHERERMIGELVSNYKDADDNLKHGILHCLHLIIKEAPEKMHEIQTVFTEAAQSSKAMIHSSAVSALKTLAASGQGNHHDLVVSMSEAVESKDRCARFDALEALTVITDRGGKDDDLIRALKTNPEPMNDKEWRIYLKALETAVKTPKDDTVDLLERLLAASIDELPNVYQMRREIIEGLSMGHLLEWSNKYPIKAVLFEIVRRFVSFPILMLKFQKHGTEKKSESYLDQNREHYEMNDKLRKRLERNLRTFRKCSIRGYHPSCLCSRIRL